VKDCCLAAGAGIVQSRTSVNVGSAVKEKTRGVRVAIFRSHMQQRSSCKTHPASGGVAKIEFGESLIDQCRVSVKVLFEKIKAAAQQI